MVAQGELRLLGEKHLPQPASSQPMAYCSSMNLLALGTRDHQVHVYRLNGQRVYALVQKGGSSAVERLAWKPKGQMLAAAGSDGSIRLLGAESSKVVHRIAVDTKGLGPTSVTCLGWVSNIIRNKANWDLSQLKAISRKTGPEGGLDKEEDESSLDLPRDLSLIDIETSLPKLSPLPSIGGSDDVFSSRASLDTLFAPFDPKDHNVVDVMVVGTKGGHVHLLIYNSFLIGSFSLPRSSPNVSGMDLILHCAHKSYSSHTLITASEANSGIELALIPMDIRFVAGSSEYLSLVASKSAALQNLLRYVDRVQNLMKAEWQSTQDLPQRFLSNINETLAEKQGCDIVQALYHSVLTGHHFPAVKEWLVDELAERGHKRWDKAVLSGLENLRKVVHEDLLPALERCAVVLSRLYGIAKYQGSNGALGLLLHQINSIKDTTACLNMVAVKIVIHVVEELEMFGAFSAWLRHEIDRLASSSTSAAEEPDKEAPIDHTRVLLYIQKYMMNSKLSLFFAGESTEHPDKAWERGERGQDMFDVLDQMLKKHDRGIPTKSSLPRVDILCRQLRAQATNLSQKIADSEKRNVLFGQATSLGTASRDIPPVVRICPKDESSFTAYVAALVSSQKNTIQVNAVQLRIENGVSTTVSNAIATLTFDDAELKSFAFLDDHNLLVLFRSPGRQPSIVSVPFRVEDQVLAYNSTPNSPVQRLDAIQAYVTGYPLPEGKQSLWGNLLVGEQQTARDRDGSDTVCIVHEDGTRYGIFSVSKPASLHLRSGQDETIS